MLDDALGRRGSFSRSCLVSSAGLRKSRSLRLAFFAMMVSIRPRTRFAVSRFSTQIGANRSWMWLGLISAIVNSPIARYAYRFSEEGH
jgi:hypothetical protein